MKNAEDENADMTGFLESRSWLRGRARVLCNDIGCLHRDDLMENLFILPEDRGLRPLGVSSGNIQTEHLENQDDGFWRRYMNKVYLHANVFVLRCFECVFVLCPKM